jgi:esterase/lipase
MLIDQEPEMKSELEAEEAKLSDTIAPASPGLPDKYRDKSLEDIVRMHQEAEKLIGKQAQEVGEVRKLADELIKQNLSSKQQTIKEEEPEVDFFENPQKAVQKTIDNHPDVLAARQAGVDFKRMQIQQKLMVSLITIVPMSCCLLTSSCVVSSQSRLNKRVKPPGSRT